MAGMSWRETDENSVYRVLEEAIEDVATGWSLGTFGALAEFHRQHSDRASISSDVDGWSVVTALGGLRANRHRGVRLLPYEGLSKLETAWTHGVMVCIPNDQAQMNGSKCITELGPDQQSLTTVSADALLFDLGLGVGHVSAAIRTADEALIKILRACAGKKFLDLPHEVVVAIKETQPVRVFRSHLGRIEVTQEIPKSDGKTPFGPHTHILPDLLRLGRAHSANVPVPHGWLPCLSFFPPNSARDAWGEPTAFDRDAHQRFQNLVEAFAPDEIVVAKALAWSSLARDVSPDAVDIPKARAERTALRVALRQWRHLNGESDCWWAWRDSVEPARSG